MADAELFKTGEREGGGGGDRILKDSKDAENFVSNEYKLYRLGVINCNHNAICCYYDGCILHVYSDLTFWP